jgi:hypothetical protein
MMSDDRVVELGTLTLPPELHRAVQSGYVVDLRIRIIDVPKDQITTIPIVEFVDPGAGPKEVANLQVLLQGGRYPEQELDFDPRYPPIDLFGKGD